MVSTIQAYTGSAVRGKSVIYLIQSVTEVVGTPALVPAFQLDASINMGGENIDEQTKQGRLVEKSTDEDSVELSQYYAAGDPSLNALIKSKEDGTSIKVWRVILDKSAAKEDTSDVTGNTLLYPALFGYGRVGEIAIEDPVDGYSEVSYDLQIIDSLKSGEMPLTDADVAIINEAYDYQNPGETTGDYTEIKTV